MGTNEEDVNKCRYCKKDELTSLVKLIDYRQSPFLLRQCKNCKMIEYKYI